MSPKNTPTTAPDTRPGQSPPAQAPINAQAGTTNARDTRDHQEAGPAIRVLAPFGERDAAVTLHGFLDQQETPVEVGENVVLHAGLLSPVEDVEKVPYPARSTLR